MLKSKKMFSGIVCVFLVFVFGGLILQDLSARTSQEVSLRGKWWEVRRSISPLIPISAFVNDNILTIHSSTQCSDITICISKNGEVVYEEIVPASETECIMVDLNDFNSGSYLIELKNQWGDYLFGSISNL
ncbi:DUF3244 domain-containing protein [uncultured Parabacteroides sp.]|uniref:DUF3244 domain-containing protein n=1 Tax=uncultured Parabacteroides sp. TaxID=512312 RepID=UPI002586137A|nr:DUF3244 domain-containing protein [uncultured Parabacteroides sp.]